MKQLPLVYTRFNQLILSSFCIFFLCAVGNAQWAQKASLSGVARSRAASFTIGNKIYVIGGLDALGNALNDFWEYDCINNSWQHNPNFPGPARNSAVAFTVGGKGYIATGENGFGFLDDLWEYDPTTASWSQKASIPFVTNLHDMARREAYSFVIGNKAYVGGGEGFVLGANNTFNYAFPDLWEYDPFFNVWTQKADIPDFLGRNMSIAASFNNKGYVGLGCDVFQTINRQSFWEYDPITDSWNAKANFPDTHTTDAAAFLFNSMIYVTGGVDLNTIQLCNNVYKYDPVADSWIQDQNFNGGAIAGQFGISTGTRAFLGTGFTSALNPRQDLWELVSDTTGVIALQQNTVCIGGVISASNSLQGQSSTGYSWSAYPPVGITFLPNNTVANPLIAFASPGTFSIMCMTSSSLGLNLSTRQITSSNCTNFLIPATPVCKNAAVVPTNLTTGVVSPSYIWSAFPSGGVTFIPSYTASAPQIQFSSSGQYTITCITTNSIGSSVDSEQISVSNCSGLSNTDSPDESIQISPNPSNGSFAVLIKSSQSEALDFCLINTLGQNVQAPQPSYSGNNTYTFDLRGLPEGVYKLCLRDNGKILHKSIVLKNNP